MLENLRNIDFVTGWKTVSIFLTGAFGILGLVKNFKKKVLDPETDTTVEKVTLWGWVSLLGIVFSSFCGIVAQLKESQDNASKALALATSTDQTLTEVKRALYSLHDPTFHIVFDVPCEQPKYERFCNESNAASAKYGRRIPRNKWVGWPSDEELKFAVDFCSDRVKNQEYFPSELDSPADLSYWIDEKQAKIDGALEAIPLGPKQVLLVFDDYHPHVIINSGKIKSLLDFHGVTLLVWLQHNQHIDDLKLSTFSLQAKDGERIAVPYWKQPWKAHTSDTSTAYSWHFSEN